MKTIRVVGARGIPNVEGGVEKNAERLFPLIAAQGWRVVLAALNQNIVTTEYQGVELWGAPAFRFLKTEKLLYFVIAALHALRLRPDIVHLSGLGAALFLWFYKIIGCKIVVRYGAADYLVTKWGRIGRAGFLLAEYQLRFADAVIAVTPALVKRLKSKNISSNVHLIPNAIDSKEHWASDNTVPQHQPYILAVGRITAQKNIDNLIRAFEIFSRPRPATKLVLIGGWEDKEYLRRLRPLITKQIIMPGSMNRDQIGNLYRHADFYINASVHEGHSNAILEAISLGCPIILSDIPENRDFKLGAEYYFDPADPQNIARAMARVAVNRERYKVRLDSFLTWDQVAEKTQIIYHGLFKNGPASEASKYAL